MFIIELRKSIFAMETRKKLISTHHRECATRYTSESRANAILQRIKRSGCRHYLHASRIIPVEELNA